jgi:hypothetical protein
MLGCRCKCSSAIEQIPAIVTIDWAQTINGLVVEVHPDLSASKVTRNDLNALPPIKGGGFVVVDHLFNGIQTP